MKKLWIVLFALVALFVLTVVSADTTESTVRASVRQLGNEDGDASGIVIVPGIVLTAQHVAVHAGLRFDGGKAPGEVIAMGNGTPLDIALLRYPLSEARCPCARLADSPALLDEKVWIVGYPLGIAQIVTTGTAQGTKIVIVRAGRRADTLGSRLITTASVAPGSSGGGVFVYRDGAFQLVGLIVEGAGDRPFSNISFAIPLEDIKAFIAEHEAKFWGYE